MKYTYSNMPPVLPGPQKKSTNPKSLPEPFKMHPGKGLGENISSILLPPDMAHRQPALSHFILQKMTLDVQMASPLEVLLLVRHLHHRHAVSISSHMRPSARQRRQHAPHPLCLTHRENECHQLSLRTTQSHQMLQLRFVNNKRVANIHRHTRGRPRSVRTHPMIAVRDYSYFIRIASTAAKNHPHVSRPPKIARQVLRRLLVVLVGAA
mmetsp:Transcript_30763/g.45171  ORF Transcript_30763/g.45171 Transcript_30763/m.45171 type:complete len:209 (-) Transcript_30763:1320-1946(-)